MHDRIKATPKTAGSDLIPIGLMSVVRVVDVSFVKFWKQPIKRTQPKVQYRLEERAIAWEPREFHLFWKELAGK